MDAERQHVKFFRFQSPAVIEGFTEDGFLWLSMAFALVDYGWNALVVDAINIANSSMGGITYRDTVEMDVDVFLMMARKINEKKPEEDDGR